MGVPPGPRVSVAFARFVSVRETRQFVEAPCRSPHRKLGKPCPGRGAGRGRGGQGPGPHLLPCSQGRHEAGGGPGPHTGDPARGLGQTCISDGGSSRPRVQGRDGGTPQPPAPRPPAVPPEEGVLPLRARARREALLQRLPPRCVCSLAAFCWEARHLIPKRAACGLIVQLS